MDSDKDRQNIDQLFQRAVQDYLCNLLIEEKIIYKFNFF